MPGSMLNGLCILIYSSQLEKLGNVLLSKNISNSILKLVVVIFDIKVEFLFFLSALLHFYPVFEIEYHNTTKGSLERAM